jgi:hypothetical protein
MVCTDTPGSRRVNVTFHHPGQTFAPKTLRSMIEMQARWNDADLRRLRLIKWVRFLFLCHCGPLGEVLVGDARTAI